MDQATFKKQVSQLQDQIGEVYCRIREARGILEILDERWGYNDPPIDVQYAYLGVKAVLKLGEEQIDQLEHNLITLRNSTTPLLPEYEDGFEDDDDDASEWDDEAQMELSFQDFEREGISIEVSDTNFPTEPDDEYQYYECR